MAMVTFSPNTVAVSADVNANFAGLANWSLLSGSPRIITNFVASGGVVALSSGLIGTFSNITYFINGQYYTLTSVGNKTYTASKDTYVDVSSSAVTYTEVANNAASPSLTANNLRDAIVVSDGSTLTVINQGSISTTGPTVSGVILTVTDTNGNMIYNTNPNPGLIGYRQLTSNFTTSTTPGYVDITNLSMPINVPAIGRGIDILAFCSAAQSTAAAGTVFNWTVREGSTVLGQSTVSEPVSNYNIVLNTPVSLQAVSSGAHTYKVTTAQSGAGTLTLVASSSPAAGGSGSAMFIKAVMT